MSDTDPSLLMNILRDEDIDYAEARRQARALLGQSAEVQKLKDLFPAAVRARVGVWLGTRFVLVGVGETYIAALEDVRTRQRLLED